MERAIEQDPEARHLATRADFSGWMEDVRAKWGEWGNFAARSEAELKDKVSQNWEAYKGKVYGTLATLETSRVLIATLPAKIEEYRAAGGQHADDYLVNLGHLADRYNILVAGVYKDAKVDTEHPGGTVPVKLAGDDFGVFRPFLWLRPQEVQEVLAEWDAVVKEAREELHEAHRRLHAARAGRHAAVLDARADAHEAEAAPTGSLRPAVRAQPPASSTELGVFVIDDVLMVAAVAGVILSIAGVCFAVACFAYAISLQDEAANQHLEIQGRIDAMHEGKTLQESTYKPPNPPDKKPDAEIGVVGLLVGVAVVGGAGWLLLRK